MKLMNIAIHRNQRGLRRRRQGAGTKTAYVQYKDRAGNILAAASDRIKFNP